MTTLGEIHDSSTCNATKGQPCPMCAAAIKHEQRQVIERTHQTMSEGCDCLRHGPSSVIGPSGEKFYSADQIALPSFDDDWELAPLSMTRTTERECAYYWYQMGQRAKEREMLMLQNADYREMLRVGRERVER